MGRIVGKLNLNKTPQLVENNSLIFAKNIKLLKDGTIGRDDGLKRLNLIDSDGTQVTLVETCENLALSAKDVVDVYSELLSGAINTTHLKKFVVDNTFVNTKQASSFNRIFSKPTIQDSEQITTENFRTIRDATIKSNYTKFPLFSVDFFNFVKTRHVRLDPTIVELLDFDYQSYYTLATTIESNDSSFFDREFFDYRNYEVVDDQAETLVYNSICVEILLYFVKVYKYDIKKVLEEGIYLSSSKSLYESKIDRYNSLYNDYTYLADLYDACDIEEIIGYIPYNTKFYLFVKLTNSVPTYSIICYDEHTDSFTPINCNWTWSGGDIDGVAIVNLNGDTILNVIEYKDDESSIPFKSINIDKSSVQDDESAYTQTPDLPIYNLLFGGYHTATIPNGVYQFFIRYKVRENYYTGWYPASKELFAGTRKNTNTNQGGLSYIDLDYDASRSFILDVEHLKESNIEYDAFQLGFIISHDDENYARSWKEFPMSTSRIYFDYLEADIREINIDDLLNNQFQLYNIKNIAVFKDKLYVANYKETDFNPEFQTYADTVEVGIVTKEIQYENTINNIPVTEVDGKYTEINRTGIATIMKELATSANTYISGDEGSGERTFVREDGIVLKVTKEKLTTLNNEFWQQRNHEHRWGVTLIDDPYGSIPRWITTNPGAPNDDVAFTGTDTPMRTGYFPIHLLADDAGSDGKYMYSKYVYDAQDYTPGHDYGFVQAMKNYNDSSYTGDFKTYVEYAYDNKLAADMSGAVEFSDTIDGQDSPLGHLFNGVTAVIDPITKKLEHDIKAKSIHFWFIKKVTKISGNDLTSDEQGYADDMYVEEGIQRQADSIRNYNAVAYKITLEFSVDSGKIEYYTTSDVEDQYKAVAEKLNNLTTLLPHQTYKFFIHYVSTHGEITNGYQIGKKDGITIDEYSPDYIIHPTFNNIKYPEGYNSCFISIQHYSNKVATIVNLEEMTDVGLIGDCLDVDTRVMAPTVKLPIVKEGSTYYGNYNGSFDSTYRQLFGASGKVVFEDDTLLAPDDEDDDWYYIVLDYRNNDKALQLVKCTPYITGTDYGTGNNDYKHMSLLGYFCFVKKLRTSATKYYSDTDVYDKTVTSDSITLTVKTSYTDWYTLYNSDFKFVYSNYNLNFMSLSLDVVTKVKMSEAAGEQTKAATIVSINSIQLSDIYELKSMYRSFSRKYFTEFTDKTKIIFNNTVRSTKLEGDEATVNIYKFESGDYYNVPANKGMITNLVSIGEVILVHTQDSLFKFVGSNNLTTAGGEHVALKENQPFESGIQELFGSERGYAGLQNKRNSLATQSGYFFYDSDSNAIFGYAGDGKLGELSSPIEKLMNSFDIENVDFSFDFKNDRLFINIQFAGYPITISYNFRYNCFVSLHDFTYDKTINTKCNAYFIKGNNIYKIDSEETTYKDLTFTDKLFPYKNIHPEDDTVKGAIVDVIFNDTYQQLKVLEAINWICKEVTEFAGNWDFGIRHAHSPRIVQVYRPLMAEEYNTPYSGELLMLYSDSCATEENNINLRSNDWSLYKSADPHIELDVDQRLQEEEPPTVTSVNAYKYPRYNLGSYSFNYFRNYWKFKEGTELERVDTAADNRSTLYGKYFVARFILDSRVNFKLENVLFITTPYNQMR